MLVEEILRATPEATGTAVPITTRAGPDPVLVALTLFAHSATCTLPVPGVLAFVAVLGGGIRVRPVGDRSAALLRGAPMSYFTRSGKVRSLRR